MSAVAIAVRELRDRSRLFLICLALAVVPFFAASLPAARADRAGVVAAVSSFLALALALGSAVAFGASTVARDLVERRLSFYFSKPVSAAAIWVGKAAAALIASFTCFAIIAVPGALVAPRTWPMLWMMTAGQLVSLTAGSVIVLFLLSHILATMIRSRSALIAVDFVLAVIAGGAVTLLTRPLLLGGAIELAGAVGAAVGVAVLLVIALAPIGQLQRGRTDIRRSHAALSRFLWPPIFTVLALAAAYELWVVSVGPADIAQVIDLAQPASGERVFIAGRMRHRADYFASFLIDARGRSKRLPSAPWSRPAFSRDGRLAAWLVPVGFFRTADAEVHTDQGPTKIHARMFDELVLSDDGSRLAIGSGRTVSVYDVASGRLLASAAAFDGAQQHAMFFPSNDVLRVIEHSQRRAGPLRIFELDVSRRKLAVTGMAEVASGDALMASADGARLLLRRNRRVVDGRTATTVAELPPSKTPAAGILRDGRPVEIVREGDRSRLKVANGPEVVLPMRVASVMGEGPGGTLLVAGAKEEGWSANGQGKAMFVIDLERGLVTQTIAEFKGPRWAWWAGDPRLVPYAAGRLAGVDAGGRMVWRSLR